jgi:hypothetical protein
MAFSASFPLDFNPRSGLKLNQSNKMDALMTTVRKSNGKHIESLIMSYSQKKLSPD